MQLRRSVRVGGVVVSFVALLACAGLGEPEPVPEPKPAPPPPPPTPEPEPEAPPEPAGDATFAPRSLGSVPMGLSEPLAGVTDVAVDPGGEFALALANGKLYRWEFTVPARQVASPPELELLEVAPSAFSDALFAITKSGDTWRVERWAADGDGYRSGAVVYEATVALSDLVGGYALWNDTERVFFARHGEGGPAILSATASGERVYEVTSPTGTATELTDQALREPPDEWTSPPAVLAARSAVPMGISPGSGALLWRDGSGGHHERAYAASNWGDDQKVAAPGVTVRRPSPNGWLTLAWSKGSCSVQGPGDDTPVAVTGCGDVAPDWVPTGRGLVGATADALVTVPVDHPLAAVRFLWKAHDPDTAGRLARDGMLLAPTEFTQLYGLYEQMAYSEVDRPVFASIDGMLEVLHAGFEAVFVRTERESSLPKLREAAGALKAAATAANQPRVATIAEVTLAMAAGRYEDEDAKAAKQAAGAGESAHHGGQVDWGDFKPRGPYAHDPELQNYFRAFKYFNLLALTDDERAALGGDKALRGALTGWTDAQAAFSTGSRQRGLFDDTWNRPTWVRPNCVEEPENRPRKPYPLFWGVDSELLDRTVAHDRLPPDCGVATRVLPNGLDLLAGLGSPYAVAWSEPDYAQWPALRDVHAANARELAAIDHLEGVVPSWWRIVQTLSRDEATPEGVNAELWHARLAETALASWTSLRHTMVLVNEVGAAEMGGGGDEGFEWLSLEPARGSVDPVPEAWERLATTLDLLVNEARARGTDDRLVEVLVTASTDARTFGGWARQQQRGEPLTEEAYAHIRDYARSIEHPYLLLKSAAANRSDGALVEAEPMQRIVDVYQWNNPDGPPLYLHAAVGYPQEIVVLAPDRGLLVPARGAVYSYREVVEGERLDDDDWRERAKASAPLPWSAAARLGAPH